MEELSERVKRFLEVDTGWGSGWGSGDGSGDGWGSGDGSGDGWGSGDGSGWGSGSGSGSGSGDGSGWGEGVISHNGQPVYRVDGVETIFSRVKGNTARGFILGGDLMLTPCFIVRDGRNFAHGKTLKEAADALMEKAFDGMDEEERIDAFLETFPDADKPVPNRELYDWHHRLTCSCTMGRDAFVRNRGIDLEGGTTVREFCRIVRNAYGGEIIRKIEGRLDTSIEA